MSILPDPKAVESFQFQQQRIDELQEELRIERARTTALEMIWHALSVRGMHLMLRYSEHNLGCTSEGYDDRPCDCGFAEAKNQFEAQTVFRPNEALSQEQQEGTNNE